MSQDIVLDETIEVRRPIEAVFAYISDFARIEEWDPAVQRATRLNDMPPGTGSEYRVDMKAGFSLHYRVVEFSQHQRMAMTVDSRWFTANEEILFEATAIGTRVRYIARFRFPGPIDAGLRLFPALTERLASNTMNGMRRALEERFAAPAASAAVALGDRLLLPGMLRFTRMGYHLARRSWKPVSAWLGGRRVIITGATSGIGLAAARALALMGASLVLVGRDSDKTTAVVEQVRQRTGNADVQAEIADLSRVSDVHALADRLLADGRHVDVLINNAGALFNPRQVTGEGLEQSFALLLLAPFLLTERLRPLLAAAAASSSSSAPASARVINVLSGGMYTQRIQVDDLQSERGSYSGAVAYARAKRGLMILTEEWARAWRDQGIVVNAMHPGWADTPGVASALPDFRRLTRSLLRTPDEGADTIVWLAAAAEAGDVSGAFWLDRERHPAHVIPGTQETAADREALVDALRRWLV